MSRFLKLFCVVVILLSICGCSSNDKQDAKKRDTDKYTYLSIVGRNLREDRPEMSAKRYGVVDENFNEIIPMEYNFVDIEENGYIQVSSMDEYDHQLVGLYDYQGNEVIPCEYMVISGYHTDANVLLAVKEYNDRRTYSLIDRKGNIIISENKYRHISCTNKNDIFIIQSEQNGKFGIINEFGEEITECKYDKISDFSNNGLAPVKLNGYFGYINTLGKEVIPCIYKNTFGFEKTDITYVLTKEDDLQIINSENQVISNLGSIHNRSYLPYNVFNKDGKHLVINKDEKIGIADKKGKLITECKFDISGHENDINPELIDVGYVISEENGKLGIIDFDGNTVLKNEYDKIYYHKSNNTIEVEKDDLHGLYNIEGKEILPIKYGYINLSTTSEYITACESDNGLKRCSIFDEDGEEITYTHAYRINSFENGFSVIYEEDTDKETSMYNYLNIDGSRKGKGNLENNSYYSALDFSKNGIAAVETEKYKWEFINTDFKVVSPHTYDDVRSCFEKVNVTKFEKIQKKYNVFSKKN